MATDGLLASLNLHAALDLHRAWREDPASLDPALRAFFEGFELASRWGGAAPAGDREPEIRVVALIEGYRQRGHFFTRTNPVRARRRFEPTLDLATFGLEEADLDRTFRAGTLVGLGPAPLREIVALLEETYCRSVGAQFAYIRFPDQVAWLRERMEGTRNRTPFGRAERLALLEQVAEAVFFEQFVVRSFVGQKTFSLEGCEALVPALRAAVDTGSALGVREFVLGMPHRGRLDVLAHVIGKPRQAIFAEFLGRLPVDVSHAGDVKYHRGWRSEVRLPDGREVRLALCPNPSHLEAVDPVAEGVARAAIWHRHGGDVTRVCPVLVHGDASIAGQGVVYEVLQMSGLRGFETGGTLHLVVNNQIGFTTSYTEGRSSIYCTDVAKVTLSPVFHVNADDVEAVVHTVRLAMEFRQRYHRDVFVDLLGYRRHGHNETDEPKYTQPLLYKVLATHPDVWEVYRRRVLEAEGPEVAPEIEALAARVKDRLRADLDAARADPGDTALRGTALRGTAPSPPRPTASSTTVEPDRLARVARALVSLPDGFPVFAKVRKVFEDRRRAFFDERRVDWATAELLAIGTLLDEGTPVRFTGQDVERGTFSQRHAAVFREDSEERWVPLRSLAREGSFFTLHNSPLSEFAVLGFEFGYALEQPAGLTIWEAQFGDFANGAQVVIDNFVACSRTKWDMRSGLVLLLPHGQEGQGSEHSSARPERFLQLCARGNLQVACPSTPASLFHLLRRQVRRPERVPLVALTPKSLLRLPACRSPVEDLAAGTFREVIDDPGADPAAVRDVLVCSGRIAYDLEDERARRGRGDVAVVRVEQLYPWPREELAAARRRYAALRRVAWVQEEPRNMGAASFVRERAGWRDVEVVSRPASDATATGSYEAHRREQAALLAAAFDGVVPGEDDDDR